MDKQYIKKYDFWKNKIKCISILLCVLLYLTGYKIILIFSFENNGFINVVHIFWFFTCILLSFVAFIKIYFLNLKEIHDILMNECDSKLYYNLISKIYNNENSIIMRSILLNYYIDGLRQERHYDVLKQVLKQNKKNLKNNLSSFVGELEMAENEEFQKCYEVLKSHCLSKLRKLNRFPKINKEKIVRHQIYMNLYEAYNLRHYNKYAEALTIYKSEEEHFIYKIEKVIHSYNIGYCLFKLNKYEEAKSYFDEVIKEGNTLYIVSKAKECNEIINQSIECKG